MECRTEYFLVRYYPDSRFNSREPVEEIDLYSVEDDGRMCGFCFNSSTTYQGDDYWSIMSGNETGHVWFGKRYTYEELLDYYKNMSLKDRLMELRQTYKFKPTIHKILKYMKENNMTSIFIDRFHGFHEGYFDDVTYDELIEKRGKELQKRLEEIMKTIPTIQVEEIGRKY